MAAENKITVDMMNFQELNRKIDEMLRYNDSLDIDEIYGQRYMGRGMPEGKELNLYGTPGNDLGVYMAGGHINVFGNGQDAVGNTMGGGRIVIHGSTGDALGYAMLNGEIYVKDNAGFRCGIHMKEYKERKPVIVIGGKAGSFLGEYMAGGKIILLGLGYRDAEKVGSYCATGMHGGVIYIRDGIKETNLSHEVKMEPCASKDKEEIAPFVRNYCNFFGSDYEEIMRDNFVKIYPSSARPYANIYTNNMC